MREHYAKMWLRTTAGLTRAIARIERFPENKTFQEYALSALQLAEKQCRELGLEVSATLAFEAHAALTAVPSAGDSQYLSELNTVHSAIEGELSTILFLRVDGEFAKYHRQAQPFGAEVPEKFPSAIQDIEGGAKALAYGLGTACVFHMMRVMEAGLRSLGKALGIPYAPSWESYLSQMEKKISAKHKTKGIKWKKDEPYFIELVGDLQAVKISWRNPTMHIVRHYSQEEAEDILRGVRRFMMRLAHRHSEIKGAPQTSVSLTPPPP